MELYNEEELNTFKDLIEEINDDNSFDDTLECIDNCLNLMDTED